MTQEPPDLGPYRLRRDPNTHQLCFDIEDRWHVVIDIPNTGYTAYLGIIDLQHKAPVQQLEAVFADTVDLADQIEDWASQIKAHLRSQKLLE